MQGISIEKDISHESLKKTDLCEKSVTYRTSAE